MDLALNNLQCFICHKTQPTNHVKRCYKGLLLLLYGNMWRLCQLDNKHHILVRKRWADTDLEFFSRFEHACLLGLMSPLERPQNWGSVIFVSLHLCGWCSTLRFYLVTSHRQLPKSHKLSLTSAYHVWGRNICFCWFHTCIPEFFGPPVFSSHF